MLMPANELEKALYNAAVDDQRVEEFYKLLMESRVFILGVPAEGDKGADFVLTEDDELLISHWESEEDKSPVIPFFTSLQTLQKSIPEDEPYLEVPSEALLRMTLGVPLVLNPNTAHGMEFSPEDVVSLLGSDSVNNAAELIEAGDIYDEDGVYLDLLDEQPEALSKSMCEVFADYPDIEAAYLAIIHEPAVDPEPHLLIGIKGRGEPEELDQVIEAAASRLSEVENDSPFEMLHFFTMEEEDQEISDFLIAQVEPVYEATPTRLH